jgi:hypothetical protein
MQFDFIFMVFLIILVDCGKIIVAYIKGSLSAVREPSFGLMFESMNK